MFKCYTLVSWIGLLIVLITKPAIALSTTYKVCDPIVQESLLMNNNLETEANTKTRKNLHNHDIDQKYFYPDLAQASIWWAAEQFDPFGGNLVENWLTYPHKQQINLIVDWQLWTLLDYFGRYRFVNQFGTVARKYGYSLNIFNQKKQCLATYTYNSVNHPPKWELYLKKLGQDSLKVEPQIVPVTE